MGVPHNSLRYAAPTGRVLLRWEGARQPVVWTVPAPSMDPEHARLELARRYLHVFGPATAASFAEWAGIRPKQAHAAFTALNDVLVPASTPIGDAWILAEDEKEFRSESKSAASARLLPSGDAYYLLQEPRDAYKHERLKDSEGCINALRDAPELEKRRLLAESAIRKALPKLKDEMLKRGNIDVCQVSGSPLEKDAEVHHIERQADQPSKSLDPSNLLLVNKEQHREIHDAEAHSPEELTALAKQRGWPYRMNREEAAEPEDPG
jgi:hypothetical protein